jgi:hypothetical protein
MKFERHVENLIAALRGLPEDPSRSILREPRSSDRLVEEVLESYRLGAKTPEDTIMENWPDVVGAANAEYSRLMRIDERNRVIVGVSNPIVRQELFFHRIEIAGRLRRLPGCSRIRAVILRAG